MYENFTSNKISRKVLISEIDDLLVDLTDDRFEWYFPNFLIDNYIDISTITYDNFTDCISEVDSDMDSIATKLEDSGWINCLYHLSGIKIIFTEK